MLRIAHLRLHRVLVRSYLEQHPAHLAAFVLIAGALATGALAGLAAIAGFGAVVHRLAHPHWFWLPVALSATGISYLGYVVAYRETAFTEGGSHVSLGHVGALVAGGFGLFIPRGGFALDFEALKLAGIPPREARVRTLSLSTLEYAVLAPAAFVVAVLLLVHGWPAQLGVRLPWAVGVPVGALIAFSLVGRRRDLHRAGGWRQRLAHALDGVAHTMRLWRRPHHGLLAFMGMALYWAGDIFVLWACLAVFSPHGAPAVEKIILGYATGYALTRRALPLAGAGAVEAMLPFALVWIGVGLATAIIAVFAYRLFNLWLPLVPAAAAVFVLRRRLGTRVALAR
jgi:uncharacterized membrane protein YbhN (UPF0104 family)